MSAPDLTPIELNPEQSRAVLAEMKRMTEFGRQVGRAEGDQQGAARVAAAVKALAQDWQGGSGHVSVADLRRALAQAATPTKEER